MASIAEPAAAIMSNTIDTSALLNQLRSMAREAGVPAPGVPAPGAPTAGASTTGVRAADATRDGGRIGGASSVDGAGRADAVAFTELLRDSLEGVNARSREAQGLRESFERGAPGVELADVMIAVQKARVSFEALTQVRNKMVSAYKDIMSTPL